MMTSKTVSTCTPVTEQGTHVFHIVGYSKHKSGSFSFRGLINSSKFSIGGHYWILVFHPEGANIIVALQLLSNGVKVPASYELKFVNQITRFTLPIHKDALTVFGPSDFTRTARCVIEQNQLETSTVLQDDCLTIECMVTVFKEPHLTATKPFPRIEVPPSNISIHFAKLLEEKKGADVIFSVGEENLTAHRIVLATRSPVFEAELFGPMKEGGTAPIIIEDMQPDVFRALLHFIYTDSLPPLDYLQADDYSELICHLLVAADRYAIERLKVMCESILCESLNVQRVATTLALADQQNCGMLKDACFDFMSISNAMDAVAATESYKNLKRTCPSVLIEALEKTSRIRKE